MSAVLPILMIFVFGYALIQRTSIFSEFCVGVKDGLQICLRIFPVLLLILVSVAVFRSSGAMDLMAWFLAPVCQFFSFPAEILPLALIRPLSGGGALSVCGDLLATYGADSFLGRIAAVLSASTETTFYTLGVYLPGTSGQGMGKLVFCAVLCDLLTLFLTVIVVRFLP